MADTEIAPADIRALGAIYFAAMLEQLKAFEVADRLLELYLDGHLPISRPGAGHALFTYWREGRERVSQAERQGLYAVAFGMPGGDAGTTPNRDFSALWIRFAAGVEAFAREPRETAIWGRTRHIRSIRNRYEEPHATSLST